MADREKADAEKQRREEEKARTAAAVAAALAAAQPRITNGSESGSGYSQGNNNPPQVKTSYTRSLKNYFGINKLPVVPRTVPEEPPSSEELLAIENGENGKGGNRATKKRGKRHSKRNAKGAPRKTK